MELSQVRGAIRRERDVGTVHVLIEQTPAAPEPTTGFLDGFAVRQAMKGIGKRWSELPSAVALTHLSNLLHHDTDSTFDSGIVGFGGNEVGTVWFEYED